MRILTIRSLILGLISSILFFSCDFKSNKYCASDANWDGLETCADRDSLNAFIKDPCLIDTNRFQQNFRQSIKLIQDYLRIDNEDASLFYVDSMKKLSDTMIYISIEHRDTYLYFFVLHGNFPTMTGNISGKDRFLL